MFEIRFPWFWILLTASAVVTCLITGAVLHAFIQEVRTENALIPSDWRIVLASSVAAVISLISMFVTLRGHEIAAKRAQEEIQIEITKKSLEINSDAAFEMWGACVVAYRLLAKGDDNDFSCEDLEEISRTFEENEKRSLFLGEARVDMFQQMWGASEEIARDMLEAGADQNSVWHESIDQYDNKRKEFGDQLRQAIRQPFSEIRT
ncbi:MAG: hypothetical protein AAFR88_05875, partial [Pseudomonadota bacterium]